MHIECKYKIWYVGICSDNGTEVVHLILSTGTIQCVPTKQILQECDNSGYRSMTVKVPEDAPMKEFLTHGNHTKESLNETLMTSVQKFNNISTIIMDLYYLRREYS